ncbi:TonB-dependent receptor domain-containing protein [Chryseobacterium luquanense]|uniref:Outer membrane beta-barrel family protein n=1 Tax=Chryseobacterium luquanense TaxID=2983766 RepID=A0ABT3XZE2_9FLAO|nr:TonB-dependent receptor [Chryseobacterium luquanense]MCX8531214.1 outer membrane beta-barrel family protein [Chryseobacterium luquanense]
MKKQISLALFVIGSLAFAQENTTTAVKDSVHNTKEIQEVLIKSQRKKQFVDKAVYSFDEEALKKARYANDLLQTLPELQFDPISSSISSIKGGKFLLLINGIESTELQARGIRPENVVRVEYYDNPPTRWATRADTVVNIITRNPEVGFAAGISASTALTTGFINGQAYANYTNRRNNFGLEYGMNFRDYDNRITNRVYDYILQNSHYNTNETKRDHFGYTYQDIALRYTNSLMDNYVFQAKFSMNIFNYFSKGNGQSIFTKDNSSELHGTSQYSGENYNPPKLDLYFSKKLGKKDEISFNVVGSSYTSESFQIDKEWVIGSGNIVFDNDMNLKAKQNSIVGEVAYTHDFKAGKLSSGYRIDNNNVNNSLQNLAGNFDYSVNYLTQYLYSEFAGKSKKLMYRLGLGLTNIHNKTALTTEDDWTITPKLILGYELKKNQSLRLTSSYTPYSPGSATLSPNINQIVPNIVSTGNPLLKIQKAWNNNLNYAYNNKFFDFNANLFYNYVDNAINSMYVLYNNNTQYALTYENAQFSSRTGIQLTGSVKPFGSRLLVIKANIYPTMQRVKTSNGDLLKNNYFGNNFTISSEYKNLSLSYMFNIPVYTLSGAFLSTNENQNHIFANYKMKDWTFTTGMYWMGMPSRYKTKTLDESLVNYTGTTNIYNNRNMFILGIGYDFAKGKKNEVNRKLNNDTAPAATF